MDYRTTKQALYGGAYLAIILLILTWLLFFFVKPAPSCFDKKQNQNEEGIDCGGVCAQICLPADLQPISIVEEPETFFPTTGKATILARLKNPNDSHGAFISYTITLYDKNNQSLGTFSENTTIYPSQVRYVIVPSVDVENAKERVGKADLKFTKVDWQLAESLPQPVVSVRDQIVERMPGNFLSVTGNVTNADIMDIPAVKVIAVFFNQFQIPIGAARTELEDFRSGETRPFTIIHPMLPSLETQRTQVFLTTD